MNGRSQSVFARRPNAVSDDYSGCCCRGVCDCFISALIQGLQSNIIERTLGTQAHIRLLSPDEVNQVIPAPAGTVQLVLEDKRAQRLRSINNWQEVVTTLDQVPLLTAVSPVVSGPAFAQRGEAQESVALVGMDPERYQKIIPLKEYMISGQLRVGADDVLIGSQLAKDLGVQVGSKLRLDTGQDNSTVVNIAGILNSGYVNWIRAMSIWI